MRNLVCIECPIGCSLTAEQTGEQWDIKGNRCVKGADFAINEITDPRRSICSTVRTTFKTVPRLSVRTQGEVPLNAIFAVMQQINSVSLDHPVHIGEVIIENVSNTGINVIATSDLYYLLEEDQR
jgi:CxxC motif-containing protein